MAAGGNAPSSAASAAPRGRAAAAVAGLLHWLRRDLRAALSLGFLLFLVAVAALAPLIAPHSPTAQDINSMLLPPSAEHWLGTDDLGRDVLSRLIHGAPATLYASFLAVSIACLIGIPIGLAAGFAGGWLDDVISRVVDTLLSFPAIVLAIGVTGALGIGLTNGMISVGIVFSPLLARLVRAQTLVVKQELYVDAARCFGASPLRIVVHHIVPNAIQPVIVQVTLLLAAALLAEASLSFLGLGVQPPLADWGGMVKENKDGLIYGKSAALLPAAAIAALAISVNLVADWILTRTSSLKGGRGG